MFTFSHTYFSGGVKLSHTYFRLYIFTKSSYYCGGSCRCPFDTRIYYVWTSLLGNLFDIPWPSGILVLSFVTFVTAWVIMCTWNLILLYAVVRFELKSSINPFSHLP